MLCRYQLFVQQLQPFLGFSQLFSPCTGAEGGRGTVNPPSPLDLAHNCPTSPLNCPFSENR